jgi:hypothetical protein
MYHTMYIHIHIHIHRNLHICIWGFVIIILLLCFFKVLVDKGKNVIKKHIFINLYILMIVLDLYT